MNKESYAEINMKKKSYLDMNTEQIEICIDRQIDELIDRYEDPTPLYLLFSGIT